ncbi:MAG: 4-hydroxy-3-methylbut-2-enyl diphosphate reductase [candidate division WOR-3 bacterium]
MPRVIVARPSGFCFGVERAIRLARAGKERFGRVATLGELVHNPLVLEELATAGIRAVSRPSEAKGEAVVIRAHGCPPQVIRHCRRLGLKLIDATCPYVRKVQDVARRLRRQGYTVVVVGERNHPEVKGILAHCAGAGRVYSPRMRLATRRIGVVAQTTMARDRFRAAVASLARLRYTELRVFDTICKEVVARQEAAARVAAAAGLVIVVGGRNSANTARLAEIARAAGREVMLAERAELLDRTRLRGCRKVAVVAGSSTPSWVVREITEIVRNPGRADRKKHGRLKEDRD